MDREEKLTVNNLKVSFRTSAGKVQAVRGIHFKLYKGETLAIVGESGSGKSVTSKAIMGISAANAIVENGEILYDGQDLLRIPEEEMHKLRGDKIAMIFQDPLSALDPIMRIGKQITEAMLLKNKANRRAARKVFNEKLNMLSKMMKAAVSTGSFAGEYSHEDITEYIRTFDAFNVKAIELENAYNDSRNGAAEIIAIIDEFAFFLENKQKLDEAVYVKKIARKLASVKNKYFIRGYAETLNAYALALKNASFTDGALKYFIEIKQTLEEMLALPQYNFFRIGYYLYKNPTEDLSDIPAEEANAKAYLFLMENYMTDFLRLEKAAVEYSARMAIQGKKDFIRALETGKRFFVKGVFNKAHARKVVKELSQRVYAGIDPLAIIKDNVAYTFGGALQREVEKYFFLTSNNPKEEKRFTRQTKRREKLIAQGKSVGWNVAPKAVLDLVLQQQNILAVIECVERKFKADIEKGMEMDLEKRAVDLVDYLKEMASQVVYKLTPRLAKEKAIKLMEEVGIPEPRIRYKQYPFEFSGGMRQRIVIAIALSANPDILICDEPTTALDVTIQAQILELINKLKKERQLSIIFITHDLGVVANIADRIAVMYAGKIVEYGTAEDLFYAPRHPYTWALLSSMPDLDTNEKLDAIPGTPPNMIYPPTGDAFAERNKYALQIDYEMQPPLFEISPTHYAATWLLHPNAPKVDIPKNITERIQRMRQRMLVEKEKINKEC